MASGFQGLHDWNLNSLLDNQSDRNIAKFSEVYVESNISLQTMCSFIKLHS